MTIDEAIEQERDNAEFSRCNNFDTSADYHNKIAEWLEELKEFKQLYLGSDTYGIAKSNYDLGCEVGYNKAMEKAIEIVKGNYRMEALEKLELLKEGGKE